LMNWAGCENEHKRWRGPFAAAVKPIGQGTAAQFKGHEIKPGGKIIPRKETQTAALGQALLSPRYRRNTHELNPRLCSHCLD